MSDFEERARKAAEAARRAVDETDLSVDDGERRVKQRRVTRRTAAISSTTAIMLIAGLVGLMRLPADDSPTVALKDGSGAFRHAGALKPFDQCDSALDYFKTHSETFYLQQYDQRYYAADKGIGTAEAPNAPATTMAPNGDRLTSAEESPSKKSSPQADSPASGLSTTPSPSHSTTNVQEKDVDEPDIVKTDGNLIVAVTRGHAKILSANGGQPVLRSTLDVDNVRNVFITGTRVVVLSASEQYQTLQFPPVPSVGGKSTATIFDIADASKPVRQASFEVTGSIVDARMVGTQVRLITTFTPDIKVTPEIGPNGQLSEQSKQRLHDAIAISQLSDWVPSYTLRDASSKEVSNSALVACSDLGHPQAFSGISTTSLVTFDAKSAFNDHHSAGVVAGGQAVYGTADTTYVTSAKPSNNQGSASSTDVHAFTVSAEGKVTYVGSGSVDGTLLDQYSMSEYKGILRIATTTSTRRGWIDGRSNTQGQVATLQLNNQELKQVGLVAGLGAADNESIKSVRFVNDRGYVTTFRQTDPFYVLDLHDANAPKIAGELKIPGFSSYLHPIGEHLVLGVGQTEGQRVAGIAPTQTTVPPSPDAPSSSGSTEPAMPFMAQPGVEFSLFDVTDPTNPKKVSSKTYGGGQAGAQVDPKAFLYYQPMDLIVSPLNTYGDNWHGLVLLRAKNGTLTEVGRLKDIGAAVFDVQRTFIIENNVYQLSDSALQVNSLTTHKEIARVQL